MIWVVLEFNPVVFSGRQRITGKGNGSSRTIAFDFF